jgi:hypothetical protein
MKLLTAATVLSVVFSAAAYAQEPQPFVNQPRSSADEPRPLSKYFDDPMPSSPNDRINWALKARGEPPLGSSRVLQDNTANIAVSRSTVTHVHR